MSSAWELHTFVWLLELGEVQGRTNTKADCAVPGCVQIHREKNSTHQKKEHFIPHSSFSFHNCSFLVFLLTYCLSMSFNDSFLLSVMPTVYFQCSFHPATLPSVRYAFPRSLMRTDVSFPSCTFLLSSLLFCFSMSSALLMHIDICTYFQCQQILPVFRTILLFTIKPSTTYASRLPT